MKKKESDYTTFFLLKRYLFLCLKYWHMLWSSSLLLLKRSVDGDQHFKLLCNLVTVFFIPFRRTSILYQSKRNNCGEYEWDGVVSEGVYQCTLETKWRKQDKRDCKTPAVVLASFFSSFSFCYSMYVYEENILCKRWTILNIIVVVLLQWSERFFCECFHWDAFWNSLNRFSDSSNWNKGRIF